LNKRRRRVSEEEETALLAVASPHLRLMIIAALDTGMRRGEMLALRFGDIGPEARARLSPGRAWRSASQIRDLLGHAPILTTERYDNQRLEALQAAVARLEEGKVFDAVRLKPDPTYEEAADKVSRIFQDPTERSLAEGSAATKEILRSK
jgi:integrase